MIGNRVPKKALTAWGGGILNDGTLTRTNIPMSGTLLPDGVPFASLWRGGPFGGLSLVPGKAAEQ